MISLLEVQNLDQLQKLMPLLLEGYRAMSKRNKAFECGQDGFVKTLIRILGRGPVDGIVVAFHGDTPVGYGAGFEDSPPYSEKRHFLMWALYVKPEYSRTVAPMLYSFAESHAKAHGLHELRAYNGRLNGSSINFFQRVLGMRKLRMEFTKEIV